VYEHIEYTPYGELWVEEVRAGQEKTPFRFTGKRLDEETGLYYYGARYLDPQTSRWLSTDPAMGEYIPQAPVNEEARRRNGNLPGMGGVFNYVNLHVYHYAGNNPVKYVDPDGRILRITFFVTEIIKNEDGGRTATGFMTVYNTNTRKTFRIDNVESGGLGPTSDTRNSEFAPFGTYDILETTPNHEGALYQRLEAHDKNYGDDKVSFKGQKNHSLIRLHYKGSGSTWGCISVKDEDAKEILEEMNNTNTARVEVNSKSRNPRKWFSKESQIKYGELTIVDWINKE
jgi:RHS repeat-associated protein